MTRKAKATPPPPPAPRYTVLGPELAGVVLLLVSLVTLLALSGIASGALNEGIADTLRWLVGLLALPLTVLGAVLGGLILLRRQWLGTVSWGRVLLGELLALCVLGLITFFTNPQLAWTEPALHNGGGLIGWMVATLLSPLGTVGSSLLLIVFVLLLLPNLFKLSLGRVEAMLLQQQGRLNHQRYRLQIPVPKAQLVDSHVSHKNPIASVRTTTSTASNSTQSSSVATPPRKTQQSVTYQWDASGDNSETGRNTPQATDSKPFHLNNSGVAGLKAVAGQAVSETVSKLKQVVERITPVAVPVPTAHPPTPIYDLPSLSVLGQGVANGVDPNMAREKARIIEETLGQFHVPARVVQVNQGPAVTQFGIQPGEQIIKRRDGTEERRRVKVSRITSLADDLALALAAKSIRVEAPVPGRPYVGIEVPNSDTETVTLHSVLTSEEFEAIEGDLAVALGRDVSGNPVAVDLARMPHLLIAGATGSGKSVCVNTIILSLLFNLGPDKLKLLMIDPKMVELIPYNGIPHLVAPVVTDMERVVGALTWAQREMDRRYKLFSEAGKRNFVSYNEWAVLNGREALPYIVILIDELADLMMVAADQVERIICRIAQMARATGMHLILATQRPSVDVVTGLIKANIPSRIAFAVASGIDSRVILDSVGAEALLGRGDMLYQAADSSKLVRLQGCFVSDPEMQKVVEHWLRTQPKSTQAARADVTPTAQSPWDEIVTELNDAGGAQKDDLLDKAIELVRESQWASTSFLQRKLRIGYTRAARLIDLMEEQGAIGPPEGSSASRKVLLPPLESKVVESELD